MRVAFSVCSLASLLLFSQCMSRENNSESDARESEVSNPSQSGMPTADPNAVSTVKRGMVIARVPPKKLKGPEGDKDAIFRFIPFEHENMQLRLTAAANGVGQGIAEEQEIDLAPYANKMIEVQGTTFGNQWVFDAKINGIVDTRGDTSQTTSSAQPPAKQ